MLAAWFPCSLEDKTFFQKEPEIEFFKSGREEECLPDPDAEIKPLPTDRKVKVYAEYEFIRSNLTDSR